MHSYNVLNRYNPKTRVGNWYQECELNNFNFKEHLYNKENNLNETLKTKTKMGFSSQPKKLTAYGDGLVRFGDIVSIGSEWTHGVLSFNINESILGEQTYAVTTSASLAPSLRNVFTFASVSSTENNILQYGVPIRLVTEAGDKKLYLQSLPASPMRSSKFSRLQQVSVTCNLSSNTLWTIQHFNPKQRFELKGQQVVAGQVILLKHCATGQWLASDNVIYINDFGKEFEVYAKSWLTNNKTQNLFSQKVGHISSSDTLRDQHDRNGWRIFKDYKE